MKSLLRFLFGTGLLFLVTLHAANVNDVRRLFQSPPREYATAPLWVWNDRLTEAQIRSTLQDLAGQKVRQAFVHPRPGLMTPYLSDEWFDLWRVALDEAKRLDMNVWIYDENSYPTGFAGGWVPELMPDSRGRGLHFRTVEKPVWATNTLSVFQVRGDRAQDLSAEVQAGRPSPAGELLVAEVHRAGNSPWHGNRCYVDLLYPGVTAKFLEVTLDAYARELGDALGGRVPGAFFDEPEVRSTGGWPWTDDLPHQFERRWGYALKPHLASLAREVGDWRRVRHNFHQTLLDLFVERWAIPYYDRCEELGLDSTGHYWEHNWPNCNGVPDNMAMAAWQHRPGIDILMNQYAEHTHAQFGNVRSCREIASLANQLGRERTLVEVYGAGGWDLRFEDMKRIGDWLLALGVNTLNEHLSYITLRGARKRDHPQSFSYHEPWWESYHVLAGYFTRLSAALSQGQQVNPVLVLEPTTSAWMHQGRAEPLKHIGDGFFNLLMRLERAQIEYDLACEAVLEREGSIDAYSPEPDRTEGRLRVGRRAYSVVVLPTHTENLNGPTAKLLTQFLAAGGTVISCGPVPDRLDGRLSESPVVATKGRAWRRVTPERVVEALQPFLGAETFEIERTEGDAGILFHHRRQLDNGELLLLVNTSLTESSRGRLVSDRRGIEVWDPFTGTTERAAFERVERGVAIEFDLAPCGSQLLFLSDRRLAPAERVAIATERVATLSRPVEVERLEPNVLTLDYVDIAVGDKRLTNVYFYEAQQFAFQQNGMDRNPWDSAVQFSDELITKTFPAESGFVATYRFLIEEEVPSDLEVVVERPDLYRISCNGEPVEATAEAWWLDRAFGRIALAAVGCTGSNTLTLTARPFTILHELEPVYIRGSFALKAVDQSFALVPDRILHIGASEAAEHGEQDPLGWNRQGHPFYGGTMAYRQTYRREDLQGRSWVVVPDWYGSVATVHVNGEAAGTLVSAPWECEVTDLLRKGDNLVEVLVTGTLKNTLGPHHNNPGRGSAWPGMFQRGPKNGPPAGPQYDTIAYGLFQPLQIKRVVGR